MWVYDELVADPHGVQRDVLDATVRAAMRNERHPPGQGMENGGGAADGIGFERLTAGEHQHDDRTGEILVEQHRADDGQAGQ
jgi:hypothetical protein